MDLEKQIQRLERVRGEGSNKMLTMYLNTDPADPDQQGGKWKINLKNGLRNFDKYLHESNDPEEIKSFHTVREKVNKYIKDNELNLRKGLILFATADGSVWFTARVQVRLKTDMYWQETPELEQLRAVREQYPKAGIILVQHNQVKIIESSLNEIEDTIHYELDLDTEDWREKLGPQKTRGDMPPGAHNLQTDQFNSRYEANRQRWYKSIAPKLDKRAKDKEWDKIIVMGEADAANAILELMNKPVDEVIQKNMFYQEDQQILNEVLR